MVTLHIINGAIALLIGYYVIYKSLVTASYNHVVIGIVFTLAVILTAVVGASLSIGKDYSFLIYMSVLTIWQVLLGIGYVVYRNEFIKYSALSGVIMTVVTVPLISGSSIIEKAIGFVYLLVILRQAYLYFTYNRLGINEWLTQHITMMVGALASITTAFLLRVNVDYNMNMVLWLLPTIILTPLVYKLRFYPRKRKHNDTN